MKKLMKLLVSAAFFNALCWIILIPVWQYPDEQAHFAQIQYIAEIGGIPKDNKALDTSQEVILSEKILGTERNEIGNNKFTYHPEYKLPYSDNLYGPGEPELINIDNSSRYTLVKNEATLNPPLYYYLASAVYNLFNEGSLFTRVIAIRILSALIFLLTIYICFKLGLIVFKNEIYSLVLASSVAFKPMLIFSSTGILPDTLTNFLFTVFIYICAKIISGKITFMKSASLLIVIILGAITRQQFLIVLFILPVVLIHQFFVHKNLRKKMAVFFGISATIIYILSFFIGSLSFIRRLDFPESSQKIANPLSQMSYFEHLSWTANHTYNEVFPWFWGIYKWLSLNLPINIYRIIKIFLAISLFGVVVKIYEMIKRKDFIKNFPFIFILLTVLIYFMAITTFDYLYRKNNGFSFGIQGRYFFPTIAAQMAIILIGIKTLTQKIGNKAQNYAAFFMIIIFMIFNAYTLYFLANSYYDTSNIQIFIAQLSQYKPIILKGNILIAFVVLWLVSQLLFIINAKKYIMAAKGESSSRNRQGKNI